MHCYIEVSATGRSLVWRRSTECCVSLSVFTCNIIPPHSKWVGRRFRMREEERKREKKETYVMKIVSRILILLHTMFHYNPYVRFIKFEMVFKCWVEYRSRWILMATSVMRFWTQQKSGYIPLVHSCRLSKEPPNIWPRVMYKLISWEEQATSSQWNRFSCITQDESDVTVWWHVQMLYFHLLHNSCNGGIALQKLGDCFALSSTHMRAAVYSRVNVWRSAANLQCYTRGDLSYTRIYFFLFIFVVFGLFHLVVNIY